WPESGVPDNPGAWLMATAKHRGVDRLRRAEVHQRKTEELGRDAQLRSPVDEEDLAAAADDPFDDNLLRLIFTACHPVLSPDGRDRTRGDWPLVGRGLAALEPAYAARGRIGPYTLQAGIAACHARARAAEDTDWERIVALYDGLAQLMPSPVVELSRAVAVGMAFGPRAGLELVDRLRSDPALRDYHLLPAARGDLLAKLGRDEEARAEFGRA